ncbi:MAG: methyl-accepting chemotaxis protein [Muribaculaceae bacterium]|nr:methyl-accepting chemotaxis protein [Roseburia sp.]MCM1430759.1 methyl-accepting chemotaxis protein [Muribaculaceae bacterium]MCM1492738.1 methyl-accepting chemotaxis protein [Muribaculaceae bacterium]
MGKPKEKRSGSGNRSLKVEIVGMSGIICICVAAFVGIFCAINMKSVLTESTERELTVLAEQVAGRVQESVEQDFAYLEALRTDDRVYNLGQDDREQKTYLLQLAEERGVGDIGVADKNGRTLTADLETYADISERAYFLKAMEGTNYVSDPLEDSTKPGTMILMISVPLYNESGQIAGVLYMKKDGAALSDITDGVVFGETGSAYMINSDGTTIAHSNRDKVIQQENAKNQLAENPSLQDLVHMLDRATQGGSGYAEYSYEGAKKCVGYAELPEFRWHVVVNTEYDEMYGAVKKIIISIIVICILAIVIFGMVSNFIAGGIVRPIIAIKDELGYIAHGNFTRQIPEKLLQTKNESGILANALQKMQTELRETISAVNESSGDVSSYAGRQQNQMSGLMSELESVSATIQELAASSQETAATTEQMSNVAAEAEQSLISVAQLADEGSRTSQEIKQRAYELEQATIRSKDNAVAIYQQSMQTLQKAIADAARIEEISKLSDAILSITSQTNLLALNASIEAARAGDSGKGFAVVASEIGHLAENSKESVNQIQIITKEVVQSVENLSSCAQDILEFLDGTVMQDYENMTQTSRQYNDDADNIGGIVSNFDQSAKQILGTIKYIVSALKDIAVATEESATGVTLIAQNSTEITLKANEVVDLTNDTMERVTGLSEKVSVFET